MLNRSQAGFSLVDLMLGMAISLICILAVTVVMVNFNQHRNSAVQGMEAQSNGAMAFYLLGHDIQQAGYGLMEIPDCTSINYCFGGCAAANSMSSLPIVLTDGGTNSDTVEVRYANSAAGAPGTTISVTSGTYSDPFNVATPVGFVVGDKVVVDVAAKCTMAEVTGVVGSTLNHATGGNFNATTAPAGALQGWDIPTQTSKVINMGSFVARKYSIVSSTLVSADFPSFAAVSRVDGIVYLKAEYGVDTNDDGVIDSWSAPSAVIASAKQVLAVRVGLVARNPLLEKTEVSEATIEVLPAAGVPAAPAVTYTVPDRHYRYKAYYSVIPLKNVFWGK